MDVKEFFQAVADRAGLSRQEAADLTRATLETLALRLSGGEVRDLALELPEPLRVSLQQGRGEMVIFGPDESIRRVRRRTGLSGPEADRGVRAVLSTLQEAISRKEFGHAMSQLGKEYAELVETTP
ncbi:DUF2267 domain-containing protein [Streptomyces libani]|uniref:DUF2267 domain-containing protein n=2 Tax=Streptomyces nigrescens TaxID=1920 RepID=A0A640TBW5_STRNI|nr:MULTISPECIES: DUF2267 domain-containing protein [Streptomyces]MCW7985487.1 hypothetical protein [Streptomyces platensis subsp. clarensis]MCX5451196.1 DUF2267 domain-containing protein [Streptomyces libani]MYT15132.1 DUF2267 domain-containing protein [Streptomyces sp. SID4951]MYX05574.1 DUF2267 domain-containing protein [Streptomyces sp. SID8375]WAT95296.1 DUF2267 domain-containing protein [Streptomyces libani subsp. libani]